MVDRMDGLDAVGRTEFDALDIDGTVRIIEVCMYLFEYICVSLYLFG